MISCIMPTAGRPEFAAAALACWEEQRHQDRELIVVDDETRPSFPDGLDLPGVIYRRAAGGSIGWKRNQCCELASGQWIAHWDDDDWSHPARLRHQLNVAVAEHAPVIGYSDLEFRDLGTGERWIYRSGSPRYAPGTTLFYRRWFWERTRFIEVNSLPDGTLIPEDSAFVAAASRCIVTVPSMGMMWASTHAGNTSPRLTSSAQWSRIA